MRARCDHFPVRPWLVLLLVTAACQRKAEVPSCEAMADHVLQMFSPIDEFSQDVRGVFATRCREDAWPEEMRSCVGETAAIVEPKNCKQKLVPEQAKKLEDDLKAAEQRQSRKVIPEACNHYERVLKNAIACDELPRETRDALAQRFAQAKAEWAAMPDKSVLAGICSSGIQALKQAAIACPGAAKW